MELLSTNIYICVLTCNNLAETSTATGGRAELPNMLDTVLTQSPISVFLNGKWFFLFIRYSGPTSEGGLETSLLFLQGLVQSPCLLYVHGNPSQSGFTATTDVQLLCLDQSWFGLSAPQQYSPAALQSISSTWHCSHHLGAWTAPRFLASPSIHT